VRERVEDVGDGDDAPDERYALAGEPGRVAAAVPPLVVGGGDHGGHLQDRRAAAREHARAGRRVALDDPLLIGAQVPALAQDPVGHRDLAQVEQLRRLVQPRDLLDAQAETHRDVRRDRPHAHHVLEGVGIAALDGGREQLQRLDAGVVEFVCPFGELHLQTPGTALEPPLRLALGLERGVAVAQRIRSAKAVEPCAAHRAEHQRGHREQDLHAPWMPERAG